MTPPRRRFLGRAAMAAAAAGGGWAGSIARALALPAAAGTGTLQDVQHVVILMQENRSFDHYFGALPGVRGFADPHPLPLPGGRSVWVQPRDPAEPPPPGAAPHLLPWHLDTRADYRLMRADGTPHRWPDAQQAWDHGRMAAWPAAKRNHSMAHFDRADLPFQTALAEAFTLCDAYHCSFQGGTHPNRHYLNTGTLDAAGRGRGPAIYNDFEDFGPATGPGSEAGYDWTTYAERLQAAGVSWHVYQDLADNFGDNTLAAFRRFRDAFHGRSRGDEALAARAGSTGGLERLARDVLDGRLPQVSWIVGTAEGSEHPWKSSPAQGADYTARVLDALTAHPEVWSRTVLFVTYDENDGFFDHVPPPAPPSLRGGPAGAAGTAGASTVDTDGEYHRRLPAGHDPVPESAWLGRPYGLGPRVPMLVVSPWSRGGWVCSQVFDHTSTIRFLEARFGVHEPNLSAWRRAVCGDLSSAFDFRSGAIRPARRIVLPATAPAAARARALPGTVRPQPPLQPRPPRQPPGARPARPLPYELHAQAEVDEAGLQLRLDNPGRAAAVVHVMDLRRLHDLPRRYTLEPGRTLEDAWPADARGRLDLWLLGPNGWHRRFAGRAGAGAPRATLQPGRVCTLELVNPGPAPLAFVLRAVTYADPAPRRFPVPAGATVQAALPLDRRHGWYDWRLTLDGEPDFQCRWAGHVEGLGADLSDPAMHGPAVLVHDTAVARRPSAVLSRRPAGSATG